jgi:hypothetical protein
MGAPKAQANAPDTDRHFSHPVDFVIPPEGFDHPAESMYWWCRNRDWSHNTRVVRAAGHDVMQWCFANCSEAALFQAAFGGRLVNRRKA